MRAVPRRKPARPRPDGNLLREILQRLSVLETQNDAIITEQGSARERRGEFYTRSAEIIVQVAALESRLTRIEPAVAALENRLTRVEPVAASLENRLAQVEPMVTTLEQQRQRIIGAGIFSSAAAKLAHAGSVAVGGALVWAIDHFFNRPGH